MGELLVHGRVEERLPPTHAVLGVRIRVDDVVSQEAAGQRAARLCRTVDQALARAQGGPDPLVRVAETSSISTGEVIEYAPDGQRRRVGWLAERTTRVECTPDAEGLTALVRELTADGIMLSGPRWHVAPNAEPWDRLRTAAVADAVRRAKAYARAVEGTVGAVRWIAEPGLRPRPDSVAVASGAPVMRTAAAVERDDDRDRLPMRISVEPVAVEVTVEVALDLA